jgi:hypothetical protein
VNLQRLGNRGADRHARIEAGQRVLEDDLQVIPQAIHFACGGLGDIACRARRPFRPLAE